jgi:hypothetical protein
MRIGICLLGAALTLAACSKSALDGPRDLGMPADLHMVTPADLHVELPDLTALPSPPEDGAPACGGGYLNSTAPDACPLACAPTVVPVPDEGALHVPYGTPVMYHHNPPASGNHWPAPAPWGVHPEEVPREWWVHNLEHQGIVLLYNCPGGDAGAVNACPNEIAQLQLVHDGRQPDLFGEVRILITPDSELPARFAAVAWDWAYVADSLDRTAIDCFVAARYGRGPEQAP